MTLHCGQSKRAREIMTEQGTALAMAARDGNEEALRETGNALGAVIATVLLEVFDGLVPPSEQD